MKFNLQKGLIHMYYTETVEKSSYLVFIITDYQVIN